MIDKDLARQVREGGCLFCGKPVHSASYPRKPRGLPKDEKVAERYRTRFSFCCSREGCRKRLTPPSVRFMGRRVYTAASFALIAAMFGGVTEKRTARLNEVLGMHICMRTLRRWRRWWLETFVRTPFWKAHRGRFHPSIDLGELPGALLYCFDGKRLSKQLRLLLRFLSPLTASVGYAMDG